MIVQIYNVCMYYRRKQERAEAPDYLYGYVIISRNENEQSMGKKRKEKD